MNCPICESSRVRVYNSRHVDGVGDGLGTVERYRECKACQSRWKTVERFENLLSVEGKSTRPDRIREGDLHCVEATRKLDIRQVSEIRQRAAQGETCTDLASNFDVTRGHVARIVNNTRW